LPAVFQKRWSQPLWPFRRHSCRHDVQLLHRKVEAFDVEMDNSSSELVDYFLKVRTRHVGKPGAGNGINVETKGQSQFHINVTPW